RRLKEKAAESRWFETTGQAPSGRAKAAYWKIKVGIPAFSMNVAAVYVAVSFDLSRSTRTCTPRLWAAMSALAMGADVNEYACTRICCWAALTSWRMASVAPPLGEKYTAMRAGWNSAARATLVNRLRSPQHSANVKRYRCGIEHLLRATARSCSIRPLCLVPLCALSHGLRLLP